MKNGEKILLKIPIFRFIDKSTHKFKKQILN